MLAYLSTEKTLAIFPIARILFLMISLRAAAVPTFNGIRRISSSGIHIALERILHRIMLQNVTTRFLSLFFTNLQWYWLGTPVEANYKTNQTKKTAELEVKKIHSCC